MLDANEISGLVQRINLMMGGDAQKKITFLSARPQEGTSAIARKFAESMAEEIQRKVLLIDAGPLDRERFITDGINPAIGIAGSYTDGGKPTDAIHKIDYNLYLGRWQGESDSNNAGGKALYDTELWQSLQKEFPYIVIDAPSLQSSSEGIALAVTADATILIVEAETTRQPVIENLRSTLESAGAKVVGTVMNKRRMYIPEGVYGRM
jgi:Mrp family chromosome partitioning ATPase